MHYVLVPVLNLLRMQLACHVDAYVTGDVKYHDAQLAKELDCL